MPIPLTIQRAFNYYIQTNSLRKTANLFGISYRTLSRRFKQYYGDNYITYKNKHGIIAVLKEYIEKPTLTKEHREDINQWYQDNIDVIIGDNMYNSIHLYTEQEINNLTYRETWNGKKDLLTVLNTLDLKSI
jgi:DNA-binding transcriptional regulator YhcF (GntR family)